jgi:hypothetical protein
MLEFQAALRHLEDVVRAHILFEAVLCNHHRRQAVEGNLAIGVVAAIWLHRRGFHTCIKPNGGKSEVNPLAFHDNASSAA